MKQYIYSVLLASSIISGSLQALVPMQRSNIQVLIQQIEKGLVTGQNIIQKIKALNVSALEDRDQLIINLNKTAVAALQKENYPNVRATTNVVQEIRQNTLKSPATTKSSATTQAMVKQATSDQAVSTQVEPYEEQDLLVNKKPVLQQEVITPGPVALPIAKPQFVAEAPQIMLLVNKQYTIAQAFEAHQALGGKDVALRDPYRGLRVKELMGELGFEFKRVDNGSLKNDSDFLIKKYYLIQLGKMYRQDILDQQTADRSQDIITINEQLKRILSSQTNRYNFGWQIIEKFEKEHPKIFGEFTTVQPGSMIPEKTGGLIPINDLVNQYLQRYETGTMENIEYIAKFYEFEFIKNAKPNPAFLDSISIYYDKKTIAQIKQDLLDNVYPRLNNPLGYCITTTTESKLINIIGIVEDFFSLSAAKFYIQKLIGESKDTENDKQLLPMLKEAFEKFLKTQLCNNKRIVDEINDRIQKFALQNIKKF